MSEYTIPIGTLEEQALKRKERLRNLKQKAKKEVAVELPAETDDSKTENVEEQKPNDVVSQIEEQLEALKTPFVVEEIDIQNLAPRKPDWDLKRDVAKKLEILERRTQRAIAELIRERLQSNSGTIDLNAVNAVNFNSGAKESKVVHQSEED